MELSDRIKNLVNINANLAIELVDCFKRVKKAVESNNDLIEIEVGCLSDEEQRKIYEKIDKFFQEEIGEENYECLNDII